MKSRITENGINYVLVGDYYIPEIGIKEESRSIGKYGMLRKQYLKEHKPGKFSVLVITGELDQHLADVDEQARKRIEELMNHLMKVEGVTEKLKRQDQMEWVRKVNEIKNRAEEIVLSQDIYMFRQVVYHERTVSK